VVAWVTICSAVSFIGSNILAEMLAKNTIKGAGDIFQHAGGVVIGSFLALTIFVWAPLTNAPLGGVHHVITPSDFIARRAATLGYLLGSLVFCVIYVALCHGVVLVVGLLGDSWHLHQWKPFVAWGGLSVGVLAGVFSALLSRRIAENKLAGRRPAPVE
jgi:hypothetical protein